MGRKWDEKEDCILKDLVSKHGKQWALIASHLVHRTPSQVAARWEKCLDPIITKGPFSTEEDNMIREFVAKNGPRSWPRIIELLPNRSSKQCRERWFNHLDPNVTKAQWSYEEDYRIFEEHHKIGGKWSQIAKILPGRTDNAVKNRWNSSISKRIEIDSKGQRQLLPDSSKRVYKHHSLSSPKSPSKHLTSSSSLILDSPLTPPPSSSLTTVTAVGENSSTMIHSEREDYPKPPIFTEKDEITKNLPPLEIPHMSGNILDSQPISSSPSLSFMPFSLFSTPSTSPMPGFALTPGAFGGLLSPSKMPPFTMFSPVSSKYDSNDLKTILQS